MKKHTFIFFLAGSLFSAIPFFPEIIPVAHAETHITEDTSFDSGAVWTMAGSPYVLDTDVTIPEYETLEIDPGVTVTTSSSSPGSLFVRGTLAIDGTTEQPVMLQNLTGFWISFSTSTISHAIINVPTGLDITKSAVTISSSSIVNADKGISSYGSSINITDSILSGNNYGIYSYFMLPPAFLSFRFFGPDVAHAQTLDDVPGQNHIVISNSSITGNRQYGIFNAITNTVNAENNWWGSSEDPVAAVSGIVDYTPWLTKDPAVQSQPPVCCSNVLFLPGLESSRLYKDQKSLIGTSTNQLWEPNRNDDVRDLFMTPAGESINAGIYTKDIMDSAFGLFPIYKNFIAMMNGVVADKTINSWLAYPYDWRFDVGTLASQALISEVESLASTSKTGKVTIVAHSNGGLIAKLLAKMLEDKGEGSLLDKVILVAVPQLGTPQAIAGLLHGDGESILGGLLMNQGVARQLGENMPGAYGLLPSKAYFSDLSDFLAPVVSFASSTLAGFDFSADGQTVSGYDALRVFLSGLADHRPNPSAGDTGSPAVLHTAMIDVAQKIHDTIDDFYFSSTTKEIILAGWGKPTLEGISYYEKMSCSGSAFSPSRLILSRASACPERLEYSASTTLLGDDTVVMRSAVASASNDAVASSSDYYFNLADENKGELVRDGHSTILNTNSAVAFVKQQVTEPSSESSGKDGPLPQYISNTAPTLADVREDDLVVSVHSPVELNIYDSKGNHTGPIPNPDPTSDLGRFETNIPDSDYVPNDGDTYVRVPYGTDYKVTFSGTGMGSFEVDTEHDLNGVDVANTTFADMPVTPLLEAELILATTTSSVSTSSSTAISATTTQMILFDFDGNGTIDATTTPHGTYDPILDMESEQAIISSLNLSPAKEKAMHDKLSVIIDCLRKKKTVREVSKPDAKAIAAANQAIADLQNQHWIFRNLDATRKQKLEDIFQAFLDDVDVGQ